MASKRSQSSDFMPRPQQQPLPPSYNPSSTMSPSLFMPLAKPFDGDPRACTYPYPSTLPDSSTNHRGHPSVSHSSHAANTMVPATPPYPQPASHEHLSRPWPGTAGFQQQATMPAAAAAAASSPTPLERFSSAPPNEEPYHAIGNLIYIPQEEMNGSHGHRGGQHGSTNATRGSAEGR